MTKQQDRCNHVWTANPSNPEDICCEICGMNYFEQQEPRPATCPDSCADCDGDGCFHAELKAIHNMPDADLQPKPKVLKYCVNCDVGVGCPRAGMNCLDQPTHIPLREHLPIDLST